QRNRLKMILNIYELSKLSSKYIQDELSASKSLLLEELLNENSDNRKLFDRLIKAEQIKRSLDHFDSLDVDSSWRRAKRKRFSKRLKKVAPYIAYAATITGVIFSIFFLFPKNEKEQTLVQVTQIQI